MSERCVDCGRPMVRGGHRERTAMPDGHVRHCADDRCDACFARRHRVTERCADCDRPMLRYRKAWLRLPAKLKDAYVMHGARGLCESCHGQRRQQKPRDRERSRLHKTDHDGSQLPPGIFRRGTGYSFKWRELNGHERQAMAPTVAAALEQRAQLRAEVARQRAELAPQRRAWRARAYRASVRAAELRQEQAELKAEAGIKAVRLERQRLARAIKQLPAEEKALGRALTHILKAAQDLDRGTRAVEGMKAVRARAVQASLYEVEDGLKRTLFGDESERRARFRA